MTGRELITKLLNDPNINLDQEVALGTKDNNFSNFGYILFHIKDIKNVNDCVNVLWFEDVRQKKGHWNYLQPGMCICPFCGAIPHKSYTNYCAKCGADLKEENNG